ncbi:MAG: hypothetical protein HY900_24530 [Deltaproteobacteria bacterium]|nr:hypothetical protein [Deltaproteobacteria bacterium]
MGVKEPTSWQGLRYVDALRAQFADTYSPGMLETGGLRMYTPLDPKIQAAAQHALQESILGGERDTAEEGRPDPTLASA